MEHLTYDFAIIGGDRRQVYIAELLCEAGYRVISRGLAEMAEGPAEAETIEEAVEVSRTVVGPVPFTRNHVTLYARSGEEDLTVGRLMKALDREKQLFAGCVPEELLEEGRRRGLVLFDFMADGELVEYNTVATAEGAIAEAIAGHPGNLHESRCLVLGYGRCGATLACKLKGLSAEVAVCERKPLSRARAAACGLRAVPFEESGIELERADIVFNTVPAPVLDGEALKRMRKEALVLDIASDPGGVNLQEAADLGILARHCPGLPGKYAPKASAAAMVNVVLRQIGKHRPNVSTEGESICC